MSYLSYLEQRGQLVQYLQIDKTIVGLADDLIEYDLKIENDSPQIKSYSASKVRLTRIVCSACGCNRVKFWIT